MFRIMLSDTDLMKNSIPIISEIIDEGVFIIDSKGISLLAPDRTMVAVVDFSIPSSSFEEFSADGKTEIGMNLGSLVDVLKRVKGGDKLVMEQAGGKLVLTILGKGRRRFEISMLDIKPEKPPIDQLRFTGKVILSSEVLSESIADAEIVSDSVVMSVDNGIFRMQTSGDTSSVEVVLKEGDEGLSSINVSGPMKARYPVEYLRKMIKASKLSGDASIEFGNDYPMKMVFAGEKVKMGFIIAPRVEE